MRSMAGNHWQEVARRTGKGVEVAVLWNDSIKRVKVVVSDEQLCHHVDLEVGGSDDLAAFHDPFAFAAASLPPLEATDEFWGFNASLGQTRSDEGANS